MFTLITLAICVPLAAVVAYSVLGDKRPQFVADVRGIALQTVIIIVVLLAIAGSVAGVLLTRAGDVTSQLESQEAVPGLVTTRATCVVHKMGSVTGIVDGTNCKWTEGTPNVVGVQVTASRCSLVQGTYQAGSSSTTAECVKGITV